MKNKDKTTWKEKDWVYELAQQRTYKEILVFIEHERDKGNVEPNGFSAGICLSDLIKYLEAKLK